jgi:DNA-binding NarL/FixJ family response regulator
MYEMTELIKLSPRERTILKELVQYETNQGIADALCMSVNTVKCHVASLLEKFSVNSKHRLVYLACRWGFFTPEGEVVGG